MQDWAPGAERIAQELAIYRGSWLEQMPHRVGTAIEFQTFVLFIFGFWRAAGLMLIGMALFRWGYFTAERPAGSYIRLLVIGAVIALPVILAGLYLNEQAGWTYPESFFIYPLFNYWGSFVLALAYLGGVMLWCKKGGGMALRSSLAAVGRMAFSNYIAQSLLCTLIFYGHGFGMFGSMQRWQFGLIVFAIWALLLVLSPWWLARFRFGPMEWLWRSLTYWRLQPFRKARD